MSRSQVQSAIIPAVIASSAVFSLLTLPFFLYRSQSATGSFLINPNLQVVLESQNRDLTIRYIGSSMVISVVTGIATVELWRRQKARQTALQAKQTASQDSSSAGLPPPSLHHPDEWVELNQSSSNWESIGQLFEGMALPEPEQPLIALTSDRLVRVADENHSTNAVSSASSLAQDGAASKSDLQVGRVTEFNEELATCRIRVKHHRRRMFAIHVAEQYYSFFRLLPTKEAALETAHLLSDRQHQIIVTPVEQQYAVWVWEPEAELELITK